MDDEYIHLSFPLLEGGCVPFTHTVHAHRRAMWFVSTRSRTKISSSDQGYQAAESVVLTASGELSLIPEKANKGLFMEVE